MLLIHFVCELLPNLWEYHIPAMFSEVFCLRLLTSKNQFLFTFLTDALHTSLARVQGFPLMVKMHNFTALKVNGMTEDILFVILFGQKLFASGHQTQNIVRKKFYSSSSSRMVGTPMVCSSSRVKSINLEWLYSTLHALPLQIY